MDYTQLYYSKEIKVQSNKIASFPVELSIEIRDFDGTPDCRVGHFGYNFWFRTNYGIKAKKYSSAKKFEQSVELACKKRGLQVLGWV